MESNRKRILIVGGYGMVGSNISQIETIELAGLYDPKDSVGPLVANEVSPMIYTLLLRGSYYPARKENSARSYRARKGIPISQLWVYI